MTDEYSHLGLAQSFLFEDPYVLTRKWSHSIIDEVDFLNEWKATESALALAFELGLPYKVNTVAPHPVKLRVRKQKKVRFCPLVVACIGDLQPAVVPINAFWTWPRKPWALHFDTIEKPVDDEKPSCYADRGFLQIATTAFHFPRVGSETHDGVPHLELRIMDEYINMPRVPDDEGGHNFPGHVPNDQHPNGRPDFTDNMLAQMDPSIVTFANLQQQGVQIRTWYIHHETLVRNAHPRLVRLGVDRSQWIQQIVRAWHDTIDPLLPKAFTLPTPMPFRGPSDQFIALGLIVSQGLHIPRFSGLVSVHFMDDLDGLRAFTIAASFADWVSGYHVVDAADVHEHCAPINGRVCNIFHGWDVIPVDAQPEHRMRPGHSFMIQVPRDPNLEVGNSQAASATHASVQAIGLPGGTIEQHFDHGPDADDPEDEGDDGSSPHDDPPNGPDLAGPMFNCHFYRLRHPPLHMFMRNAAGVPMLIELARQLGVVPASLLQAHPMRALMTGERMDDFSFVVQSVTDLPAASSDMLVVIDVEVHFHPTPGAMQPLPAAARRVVRVPLHITRDAVLGYAGVQQYCREQDQRCLVLLNGQGWPILQPGPRVMRHGNYLRVIVPPPLDGTNTLQAIHLAETRIDHRLAGPRIHPQVPDQAPAHAPSPPMMHVPAPPPVHSVDLPQPTEVYWFERLQQLFEDQALVEFEEEGPILYLWTWYINHQTHPRCLVPKVVKLDQFQHLWLQDLYEPWRNDLQLDAPTQVRIVDGRPPIDSFRIDAPHIMIEQHPCEGKTANVLSAVFHAANADRLLQAAYSMQRWLCTEDVIDVLQINHICEFQRCRAVIGRIPLDQFVRHDVTSASSIELHVRPPHCVSDETAASSNEPYVPRTILPTTAQSLMQVARRWRRQRISPSDLVEEQPEDHVGDSHQDPPTSIEICDIPVQNHPPAVVTPWPTTWQTLEEVWNFFFGLHANHFADGIYAEIWYSDHIRRPWSEAGKIVHLTADFTTWLPQILQVWADWYLPADPFEILVVTPTPIGGERPVQFHAILLQQPQPEQRSAVLTVMDRFADPWVPDHVCVLLPQAVDHWHLLHAAVVDLQCPPHDPAARCRTHYGNVELTAGNLFPVRHAMCFSVVVEAPAPGYHLAPIELPGIAEMPAEEEGLGFLQKHCHRIAAPVHTTLARQNDDQLPKKNHEGSCPSKSRCPVQISLDAVLTPAGDPDNPAFDDTLSTLQWLHDDNWAATCANALAFSLQPLPDGMHVPLESFAAIDDPTLVPPCGDGQWELYVDGATSSTAASWSVVVVRAQDHSTFFHGQISGPVEINSALPAWIGADTLDNIAAEFEAFIAALLLALGGQLQGNVILRPDLRLSRAIAVMECATGSNPLLANLIRHLSYCLGSRLVIAEVRGHRRHPWNELADRIAKHALASEIDPSIAAALHPLHKLALSGLDSQWTWLQQCPRALLHAFPPLCDGTVMQFPLSLRRAGVPVPSPQKAEDGHSHEIRVAMNLLTANVLALDTSEVPKEVGRRIGVRTQRLDAQWHEQRFHILGLQETRTPQGVFQTEHYQVWSSGHQTPGAVCLGCELWCHKFLPIATSTDSRPLVLADFRVVVAFADPRRLVVRFENAQLSFTAVVLHAPCLRQAAGPGHRSLQDVQAWWHETAQVLRTRVHDCLAWYFVDANAPLASSTTEFFGMYGAEPMNAQGEAFENFIQEMSLHVPCTFEHFHVGSSTTWTHPSGKKLRRDATMS